MMEKIEVPIMGKIVADKKLGNKVIFFTNSKKEKEPKHITKGIELSKKLTEDDVYNLIKEEYEPYFLRGDTLEYVKSGQMGGTLGEFVGSFSTGGHLKGEKIKSDIVGVELSDDRIFKFKLINIFNDITKKTGRQVKLL